jgi:hypothetical protein
MTIQEVTLVAAVVAAIASVLNLVLDRRAEARANNGTELRSLLGELGDVMNGIVAASEALATTETPRTFRVFYTQAFHERERMKMLRPKLRYPLWGLDEGLQVLERLPVWCAQARSDRERAAQLLRHARELRRAIDRAALRCHRSGRRPSALQRARVRLYSTRCRRAFEASGANSASARR